MAFKCQPGLDTCVTVTPGAHPYTSFNKHRAPASFVIQEQCMVSRESRDERRRAPSGRALDAELACPACTFLSPASLPLSPGKRFGEGRITRSQTPVIWQKITQMGQTEPAEPTGSWEWWCTGCFLSTGCTVAQKLHRLTHQTEPLKEGPQRDRRGRGEQRGGGGRDQEEGTPISRIEWRAEVWGGNDGRRGSEATLWTFNKKKGRGRIRAGWYRRRFEGEERGDKLCGES